MYHSFCVILSFSHSCITLSFFLLIHLLSRWPLLISIILSSLLTLSTFTRFSLYYLHSVSCILLPILTLLPPSLFPLLRSLSLSLIASHNLAEYTFILLFGIASINPSLFRTSSFRFTSVDKDRNRYRWRG